MRQQLKTKTYTLVFTPRYGVEADTFTLTGDPHQLAYELVRQLEELQLSETQWRVQQQEESKEITVTMDGTLVYLVTGPGVIHDIAFSWCSLSGRHTVQMFDASPAKINRISNQRKVNP